MDDGKYGTVWVPSAAVVGEGFVPYASSGHWVYGDDYTWVSDYDWGWAPFHYGRWVNIDGRGWGWIPGRRYAPAWGTWRVGAPGFGFQLGRPRIAVTIHNIPRVRVGPTAGVIGQPRGVHCFEALR